MAQFSDLTLDPITNDLQITNRDLIVIQDTTDAIVQRLRIRLKFFKAEWFLNLEFGLPFTQTIFVKGVTQGEVDSLFRTQILGTPGVIELLTFTSTLDPASRAYTTTFSCRASTGDTIILEV